MQICQRRIIQPQDSDQEGKETTGTKEFKGMLMNFFFGHLGIRMWISLR